MDGAPIPAELAAAVTGAWRLGDTYRVVLSRSGKGLRAHQEGEIRIKGRVRRDSPVEYDPASQTLHFPGVGPVHKTVVTLRRSTDGGLEYSFASEISPGK